MKGLLDDILGVVITIQLQGFGIDKKQFSVSLVKQLTSRSFYAPSVSRPLTYNDRETTHIGRGVVVYQLSSAHAQRCRLLTEGGQRTDVQQLEDGPSDELSD